MARIAAQEGIVEGAIANVVLRLTFADEAKVKNVFLGDRDTMRFTNAGTPKWYRVGRSILET